MDNGIESFERIAKLQRLKSISGLIDELEIEKNYIENYLQEFDKKVISNIQFQCPVSKERLKVVNDSTIYCTVCEEYINRYEEGQYKKCFFESDIEDDDFVIGF